MGIGAAATSNVQSIQAEIAWYTREQIVINQKYEANLAKLEKQTRYETQWQNKFDSAINNDREINKCGIYIPENNENEDLAIQYADKMVDEYNAELLEELTETDMNYDSIKTMLDTVLEKKRSDLENARTMASTEVTDNCLLNAG